MKAFMDRYQEILGQAGQHTCSFFFPHIVTLLTDSSSIPGSSSLRSINSTSGLHKHKREKEQCCQGVFGNK